MMNMKEFKNEMKMGEYIPNVKIKKTDRFLQDISSRTVV